MLLVLWGFSKYLNHIKTLLRWFLTPIFSQSILEIPVKPQPLGIYSLNFIALPQPPTPIGEVVSEFSFIYKSVLVYEPSINLSLVAHPPSLIHAALLFIYVDSRAMRGACFILDIALVLCILVFIELPIQIRIIFVHPVESLTIFRLLKVKGIALSKLFN